MTQATIELPPKLVEVFAGSYRIRGAYGGRGSGKTRSFALMAAVHGYRFGMSGRTGQILCAREFMNSLAESSFQEIKGAIKSVPWLDAYYDCGDRYIRSKDRRIEFIFQGLRHNIDSVKSKSKIILAWIDEADSVSEEAWVKLMPSVREKDSEVWVTWNPERKNSPVDIRFRRQQSDDMKVVEINYTDNPWFPEVLEIERQRDLLQRPELYPHIWEGEYLEYSEGAYYARELRDAVNRICHIPVHGNLPCCTFWDIGASDGCAIWVSQRVGQEFHLIDFYESWGEPYSHAISWLQSKSYVWDTMYLPHDADHRRQGSVVNKSPKEMLRQLMPNVRWEIVPRIQEIDWGIRQTSDCFPMFWFDSAKCEAGLEHLRLYRRKWVETEKRWSNKPDKSEGHSEAADALRQLAQAYTNGQLDIESSWGKPIKRNLKGIA